MGELIITQFISVHTIIISRIFFYWQVSLIQKFSFSQVLVYYHIQFVEETFYSNNPRQNFFVKVEAPQ